MNADEQLAKQREPLMAAAMKFASLNYASHRSNESDKIYWGGRVDAEAMALAVKLGRVGRTTVQELEELAVALGFETWEECKINLQQGGKWVSAGG